MNTTPARFQKESLNRERSVFETEGGMAIEKHNEPWD
jgi:hypothetical protein